MKKLLTLLTLLGVIAGCSDDNDDQLRSYNNPMIVDIGKTYNETIRAYGTNVYKFVSAGGDHKIELKNLHSDLSVTLYDDTSWETELDYGDDYDDATDETLIYFCLAKTYYLVVDEWDGNAGSFTLQVSNISQ